MWQRIKNNYFKGAQWAAKINRQTTIQGKEKKIWTKWEYQQKDRNHTKQ